jgi:hypothetical protein
VQIDRVVNSGTGAMEDAAYVNDVLALTGDIVGNFLRNRG